MADSQQQSLLRLALEGISVYCPHTAVDAVAGGLGDWLADIVTGANTCGASFEDDEDHSQDSASEQQEPEPVPEPQTKPTRPGMAPRAPTYSNPTYPASTAAEKSKASEATSEIPHVRSIIRTLPGSNSMGMGRLVKYEQAQPLSQLIERIARGVGSPKGFPVAIPQNRQVEDILISSVGVCAGSGQDVLRHCSADLLFTGELSHHDALAATEQGKCVVSLFHSNSERGYLGSVMKNKLTATLKGEWQRIRREGSDNVSKHLVEEWQDALQDDDVQVEVSEQDRDPYGMVLLQSEQKGHLLG